MFMRCGVILIVRVFFYIFTPLITTTTRLHLASSHRRHCLRACQHVHGRSSRGPDVALAQSGRCERVPQRSSNDHRIMFLCLFGGRSAATAVTPPWSNQRTWRPFWPMTEATSAFCVPKPSIKGERGARRRPLPPWTSVNKVVAQSDEERV